MGVRRKAYWVQTCDLNGIMKFTDGVHSDFANVSYPWKGDQDRGLGREGSMAVSPLNTHGHETQNPSTRAIMFDIPNVMMARF